MNKHISILTYDRVHNHGALFQANGLSKVLKQEGYIVDFISFKRDYRYLDKSVVSKYKFGPKTILFYIRYFFKKGFGSFVFHIQKKKIMDKIHSENFKKGPAVYNKIPNKVIVGSDEVFAADVGFNEFMYGSNLDSNYIISYAACFGSTNYEDLLKKDLSNVIRKGLAKFKTISVRDLNSQNTLRNLGFSSEIVCDPVILYGYRDEINSCIRPLVNSPYIVLYSYDKNMNDPDTIKAIKKFAAENKFLIVSVGFYHKWCDKNICGDLNGVLNLFKFSKFVITDTFHGTVLSLITNKTFSTKIRNNSPKISWLLKEYSLENREIQSITFENLTNIFSNEIDYHRVNNVIEINRIKSLNYLREALTDEYK